MKSCYCSKLADIKRELTSAPLSWPVCSEERGEIGYLGARKKRLPLVKEKPKKKVHMHTPPPK